MASQNGSRLDELFSKLLTEKNPALIRSIESRIWRIWLEADDAATQGDLTRGMEAMNAGDARTALDAFKAVVEASPDFAEGWNKRATLYYLMGGHAASIADIERTLALEPRHFGALSGLALIHEAAGRSALTRRSLGQCQANRRRGTMLAMNLGASAGVDGAVPRQLSGQSVGQLQDYRPLAHIPGGQENARSC